MYDTKLTLITFIPLVGILFFVAINIIIGMIKANSSYVNTTVSLSSCFSFYICFLLIIWKRILIYPTFYAAISAYSCDNISEGI